MTAAALNQTDQKRLERLAAKVGRSQQATLAHVLKDSFTECEAKAGAVLASLAEIRAGKSESPEKVEAKAEAVIARYGEKTQAA